MDKPRIMVVDDSNFFRATLKEALENGGCEVVGEAKSFEELIDTYKKCKPDIVTMDIAMPGKDGFECSKALLLNDPFAKIIIVSSMKDEGTEKEAKCIGISGYVQKPVESDHLMKIVHNILAPDELYENLNKSCVEKFKLSFEQNYKRLTKQTSELKEIEITEKYMSKGISIVTGIIGKYSGILLVDISTNTAYQIAECMLKREAEDLDEVLNVIAEFTNIVGGVACSMLNKDEPLFKFRVAPPSIFYGESTEIINPCIKLNGIHAETQMGNINMSVGFKEESVLWT